MPAPVTAAAFRASSGVDDWQVAGGHVEVSYRAASFTAAGELVRAIAAAADAADHHPDVTLTYPGVVAIQLSTHSIGGLSELDVALARTISGLAAAASAVAVV